MIIDPHVHCRDGAENYKETIAHVFKLCDEQGVDMVFDMPNTSPPIISAADVEKRLALVPASARTRYRVFVGVTADEKQLAAASELAGSAPAVAGLKLYAGPSVGSLAVAEEAAQKRVYEILAGCGYRGVLAVHCEKQSLFRGAFVPAEPESHCRCRPLEAELASITDQITFAREAGFKGALHICHVSTAEAAALVRAAAEQGLRITCAATPHHLLWTDELMRLQAAAGLLYKVNPPLRPAPQNLKLRDALAQGLIDWVESDHAPHALAEKLHPPYLSGYPSLCLYKHLVTQALPEWGLKPAQIKALTSGNIIKTFGKGKIPCA